MAAFNNNNKNILHCYQYYWKFSYQRSNKIKYNGNCITNVVAMTCLIKSRSKNIGQWQVSTKQCSQI